MCSRREVPVPRGNLRRSALVALLGLACGGAQPAPSASKAPKSARSAPAQRARAAPAPIADSNVERVRLAWEAAIGGKGRAVGVSRQLGRVAAAGGSPLHLFEVTRGRPLGRLAICADVVRGGVGFFGAKLVVVCESGVERWDPVALRREEPLAVTASRITAVALQPPRIALGHRDGVVRIHSLDGSAPLEIAVPGPPIDVKSLALTRDGARVAVAWVQGSVWWWSTADPTTPHALVRHEKESDALAFSHDGALLAEEGKESFTTLWSFGEPAQESASIRNGAWIKRIHFTRDGRWLVRGGADGVELAEIAGPRRIALDTRDAVEDVGFDEKDASFAAVDRGGRLTYWSVR